MHYHETLDYLFSHLPMFQRIGPAAYKKDLTNTLALCKHLGNPHQRFPTIHVGGTNGKGSVSHLLAAALQATGLKVGLYISPHYKDIRERIKVNGVFISKRKLAAFVNNNKAAIETINPSFFELTVAMAFDHFAKEKVDIAVIEVGVGGRLDSTNIITPMLSVITNISFDHTDLLGDTLAKIAFEKAGIIKPGIPVVVGETHPETAPVFQQKAAETGSDLYFADHELRLEELEAPDWQSTRYRVYRKDTLYLDNLDVNVSGPYQKYNVATALLALEVFSKTWNNLEGCPKLGEESLRQGWAHVRESTRFIGRWQKIGENPTVLCDSAHNEAGLQLAFERIRQLPHHKLHVVTGFVNDKDVRLVLPIFPKEAAYYFAKADIPRGLNAEKLREAAAPYGLKGKAYSSVRNALKAARRAAAPNDDLVVVIGSIFIVGEAL